MSKFDKAQIPNIQESLSSVQFALTQKSINAHDVRVGLENLVKEIKAAKNAGNKDRASDDQTESEITPGDLSRVGISLDSLRYIEQKLLAKQSQFGDNFPLEQAKALTEMVRQIENYTDIWTNQRATKKDIELWMNQSITPGSGVPKLTSSIDQTPERWTRLGQGVLALLEILNEDDDMSNITLENTIKSIRYLRENFAQNIKPKSLEEYGILIKIFESCRDDSRIEETEKYPLINEIINELKIMQTEFISTRSKKIK